MYLIHIYFGKMLILGNILLIFFIYIYIYIYIKSICIYIYIMYIYIYIYIYIYVLIWYKTNVLFCILFFVIRYALISRSPSLCSSLWQRSALLPWQDNLSRAKAITVCKSKQREVQTHSKADKSSIQLFLLCGHCNMKSHNRTHKFV